MVELTVTIVTYNTDIDLLHSAINSVVDSKSDVSIVVADNSENDLYHSLLKQQQFGSDKVKVVRTGFNGGYGYGHNYAEKHCPDSKYHLVMNADVVIHANSLDKMLQQMRDSDISILSPKVLNIDGIIQYLNKREPALIDLVLRRATPSMFLDNKIIKKRMDFYEMRDVGYNSSYDLPLVSGCFMLFARDTFRKVDGFDERYFMYFEDFDICKKVSQAGGRITYMHNASITHFWERGSAKNFGLFVSLVKSMVLYFNKWGWKLW